MAKKRKLRSEPEPAKIAEEESTQPEDQPHNMAVDEENSEPQSVAEQQQDQEQIDQQEPEYQAQLEGEQEGEEEEDPDEDEQTVPQSDPVQPEANGGEGQNENNGSGVSGDDDDLEDEPLERLLEPFSKDQMVTLVKKSIEKYPDLIETARALADADPAHRKIFVHGLGWDTTAETLTSVFGKFGEIEDCKHVTDRVSGKSKGYAFILFKHRSGARRALKEPQKKIGNRTTSCQLATTGPVPAPPPTGTVAPVVSELTQRKIFVSNVSAEIDPQKLLEFFRQFGEIEEGPLGLDKQTGKPKGFALFVYKSIDSAKKALEEPHKNFEGVTLHCQKAIDGPKPGKPYGGGGGGGGGHHHQQGHHYHQQPHYHHRKDKNKYGGGGGGGGGAAASGHLMAPAGPGMGFSPGAAGAGAPGLNPALGQALTALLATQGAGLGIGNLLGGMGPGGMNQGGVPGGYGNQSAGGYAMQPGLQSAYQNPQMGQGNAGRPPQGGGAPYMGH